MYHDLREAVQNFDFDTNRYPEANEEMRVFAETVALFVDGNVKEATTKLIEFNQSVTDSSLKKESADLAGDWQFLQSNWQEMLDFDKHSGFLLRDHDSTGVLVRAFAQTQQEKFIFTSEEATLPLKLGISGIPEIEVDINGHRRKFFVDTGAGLTTLASDVASEVGVNAIGASRAIGGTSTDQKIEVKPARIRSLRVGNVKIENHPAAIVAKEDLEFKLFGLITLLKVDGIIGWPLLQQVDFELDYAGETMTIRRPRKREVAKRNLTWFDIPILEVSSERGPLFFRLDTGANTTSLSNHALTKIDTTGLTREKKEEGGAGGRQTFLASKIPSSNFVLGQYRFSFKDITTGIEDENTFFRIDGTIGSDIFTKGSVRIDFTNGRLEVAFAKDQMSLTN